MTFAIDPGTLGGALEKAYRRLEQCRFAEALRTRRLDVWSTDRALQQQIATRLGWLDASAIVSPHLPRLRALAESIRDSGVTDIILLGMGGSSLAPEVLRAVIGVAPGFPRFQVLDSVDPDAVRAAMARPATSLFVLASKSGSTIEPNSMAAEAERRVREAGVSEPGSRFVAITDQDTTLHRRALDRRFREVFINPADVGGRYSALSFFGMVPAALMGIDMNALLASARAMAEKCLVDNPRRNPGLALGAVMAAAALAGRDKLTLSLPPRLEPFGLWVEQLVAESTGKRGKGIVPITGEGGNVEAGDAPLGDDRVIVRIVLAGGPHASGSVDRECAAHLPTVSLDMPDLAALGAEFFRWETAAATAGLLLDINPFDEPNVRQAKDATRVLLDAHSAQGRLPVPEPDAVIEGVRMTLTGRARQAIEGPLTFLRLLRPPDYFGLLVYLPPEDEAFARVLQELRHNVAAKTGCATTLGYGPRYLHSTGQLHKGGPNTGGFIIMTAEVSPDLPIPGEPYSFGVLELAQASGDFESLNRTGRRALHLHLPQRDPDMLRRIGDRLIRAG
ncbi:MAG: glucose-6-phosphate isomerase [Acidobacteria bacterium]|nr:glucose-6-phosphate isomerase [Acidobacteriota bacterium]